MNLTVILFVILACSLFPFGREKCTHSEYYLHHVNPYYNLLSI